MTFHMDWIVENRILYIHTDGKLSDSDLKMMSQRFDKMARNAVAPLHVIEDDRHFTGFKGMSVDTIRSMFEAVDFSKLGYALAIVPDNLEGFADIFGNITEMLTDVTYERVNTVPEALDFIAKHDATLPDRSQWTLPEALVHETR